MPDVTRIVLLILGLFLIVAFFASTWSRSLVWVGRQAKERGLPMRQQTFWRFFSYVTGPVAVTLFAIFVPAENESRWDIFGAEETETAQTEAPDSTVVTNAPAANRLIDSDYYLRIRQSSQEPEHREYRLVVGGNVVGRNPQQTAGTHPIRLGWDNAISGEHLRIDVRPNGAIDLSDLNSRYGTKLNGRRIAPNRSVRVNVEDHITCGNTVMELSSRVMRLNLEETQAPLRSSLQYEQHAYTPVSVPPLQLTVVRGTDVGKTLTLKLDGGNSNRWIVGRSADASWPFRDRRASKKHLEIRRNANIVQVRDLGSKRGTFINNRKVKKEFTVLNVGDTLRVGSNQIRLEREINEK